jgi:hypothetical protein
MVWLGGESSANEESSWLEIIGQEQHGLCYEIGTRCNSERLTHSHVGPKPLFCDSTQAADSDCLFHALGRRGTHPSDTAGLDSRTIRQTLARFYALRKTIVEPVFGQIKQRQGSGSPCCAASRKSAPNGRWSARRTTC